MGVMGKVYVPPVHPIYRVPTENEIQQFSLNNNMPFENARVAMHNKRNEIIAKEKSDPIRTGWESPKWILADMLLDMPWVDRAKAESIRKMLGFDMPVRILLILGGNRSGKSEYAAKRTMLMLMAIREASSWVYHTSRQNSIELQQQLLWKYMPRDIRPPEGKAIMSSTTYISYKGKTGFSEDGFMLPNKSRCSFRNYGQDISTIEGGELDWLWDDEIVPIDWLNTQILRLATRAGRGVVTYTPVLGYTGVVKEFLDGAKICMAKPGWLLPTDEGAWDEERAIKLDTFDELMAGVKDECKTVERNGRKWEEVPLLYRCQDRRKAAIFFHPSDNPFGNPKEVIDIVRPNNRWYVRERFYGIGNKLITPKFPKFGKAHIIKEREIPKDGTRYHIVDPCSGRNWYMIWVLEANDACYVYREWPGNYNIPGVGHPGPWAEPSGKQSQVDGRKGSAQKSLGWGLMAYKREIARLEGWYHVDLAANQAPRIRSKIPRDMSARPASHHGSTRVCDMSVPSGMRESDWVRSWIEGSGPELIAERYIDSRFANVKSFGADEPETLLEELADWGLYFRPTSGGEKGSSIGEGCELINDALYYDEDAPISFFNRPRLYISEKCTNLIYAMENWTGDGGKEGATKDPIDVLRYKYLMGCEHMPAGGMRTSGGGHY